MAIKRHPLIAREGWWDVGLSVIVAGAVHYFFGPVWAAPLWVLAVIITQFFRDPPRKIPAEPLGVICRRTDV